NSSARLRLELARYRWNCPRPGYSVASIFRSFDVTSAPLAVMPSSAATPMIQRASTRYAIACNRRATYNSRHLPISAEADSVGVADAATVRLLRAPDAAFRNLATHSA